MTIGLCKGRNTAFLHGYAVQWFTNLLKHTKVFVYAKIPGHRYILLTEMELDYAADEYTVKLVAGEKIKEIEAYA